VRGLHPGFLAAFDHAIARAAVEVREAYGREVRWVDSVRAGLMALLGFLEREPELAFLCVVQALAGGPAVLERRGLVLAQLARVVDGGRGQRRGTQPPPLTAEGVVGAVFSVLHSHLTTPSSLASKGGKSLSELLGPLMGMIVLPYLGPAAAAREFARATRRSSPTPEFACPERTPPGGALNPFEGLPMRVTYRTLRVLSVIGEQPGASNRDVADGAGVSDQGQISKLLTRLQRLELVHNEGEGHTRGAPNAWQLTPRGTAIQRTLGGRGEQRRAGEPRAVSAA
jgi:AcrR family transcriptional regulator